MKKFLLAFLFLALLPTTAFSADLEQQIKQMKEDIEVLQRQLYRNQSSEGAAVAGGVDVVELGKYDETVRQAMGKMEEMEHKIKKLNERIDMVNKDVDVRIKMIEGKPIKSALDTQYKVPPKFDAPKAASAPKNLTGEAVAKGEVKPVEGFDVEKFYSEAMDALKAKDNAKAEEKFAYILTRFPDDKLAANAQYWLGEIYYGNKAFDKAAVAFGKCYQNYKTSPKAPDCFLKLGMSMRELKKTDEACAAFMSMEKEFPTALQEVKDKAKNAGKNLQCK